MKQSTKLLSLVLALVMAFSFMTVIGNAALVKSEVKWDNIDDADLTAEQVADLALDLVENDLLSGIETVDLSILGEIRLNKIDYLIDDILSLRSGFVWAIGNGLLGNIKDLEFEALVKSGSLGMFSSYTPYSRSHGDLEIVTALLRLIGGEKGAGVLSKAAYGIGTSNGVSLGLISTFLDLGEVGDMLADIPNMLVGLLYDMLIFGSYGYEKDFEELGNKSPFANLDAMVNAAINNLLVNPQDYTFNPDTDEKIWDMKSIILPSYAADPDKHVFDLTQDSVFEALDIMAQYAIDDIGINALNNNLKKALMEAVEADFVEIDEAILPAAVAEDFEVDVAEDEKSYVTYLAYDRICKDGTNWYYTTVEREDMIDDNGDPIVDEEGNVQTERVRKYFKVNMAAANEFAGLINWDWNFVGSEGGDGVELSYEDVLSIDGTIAGGINHLISIVFENALVDEVKADFEDLTGDTWIDGGNEFLTDNITRIVKYLLVNFGDRIFGSDSAYANYTWDDVADLDVVQIVAMIGPGFFQDVMPQIIIPRNDDGTYAFHDGVQILEFGALVIREFATDIAPNVNYDSYIFEAGNVKSANDRLLKEYDVEGWFNVLLNIGVDIGYTYLNQITNFNTAIPAAGITEDRWQGMLDTAIEWGLNYISDGTYSVLMGMEPATVMAIDGPLSKLSYVLNTILPLGFINGCAGDYAFDLNVVLEKLKEFFATFDLSIIASFFGRSSEYNILNEPVVPMALNLVNGILKLVFNKNILPATNNLSAVIDKANLQSLLYNILTGLYDRARTGSKYGDGGTGLLTSALPVVGKLIKGWGTEQNFNVPEISLSRAIDLTNGATSEAVTVNVRNASDGVWRHYKDAAGGEHVDEQYKIVLKGVSVYDEMSDTAGSKYVSVTQPGSNPIDYGQSGEFKYTAANVPTSGALVRFEVKYQVLGEDGVAMANGKEFVTKSYAWLNYNPTDAGQTVENSSELIHTAIYTPQYVPISTLMDDNASALKGLATSYFGRDYKFCTNSQTGKVTNNSGTVDGLTFASLSQEFANNNKGRYARDVRNFDAYTHNLVDEDGNSTSDNYNVQGKVDAAAWTAANKTSGSKTNFSITLTDKDGSENATFTLVYYDDVYYNKLNSLAINEMDALRLTADYNLTGTVYANNLLTTANTVDEETGDIIFRESNFSTAVWVLPEDIDYYATGSATEYADAQVIDKVYDEETGEAVEGKVVIDGKETLVKRVTKIDCATAINAYVAAFVPGIRGGMQAWNANSVYNLQALYEAFYVSSNDVGYCKKTAEQVAALGDNVDGAVAALKTTINSVEATYTDSYDYRDYKMYRLNRLNDARDDAWYYVNLQNDASNATVAEIDEVFPYTSINEDDLRALVAGDKYSANILALLEKMDEDQLKQTTKWLEDKKLEYQQVTLLDVEMAQSYLELTSQRLLKRDHGVLTNFLADEIASAEAMVGAQNEYTARSWAKYSKALADAKATLANPTQKTVFEAKYELMCCRNELVLVDDEADYSELEAVIEQATFALENQNLYDNTAKDFGMVLAELGYHSFTNADGDSIDLFPGSAIYANTEPYGTDEQDVIDSAANELKVALARLKFKNVEVSGAGVADETLVEGDEEAGIEEVVAKVARIDALLDADAVKALFSATADGANVTKDLINVSDDTVYTVDTDLAGFAGTDATVTFYTLVSGVKIPVATVKIVVEGDINGDGVINVLDASIAELASNEHAELEGCFFLAANLAAASEGIADDDYSAVLNKALAA